MHRSHRRTTGLHVPAFDRADQQTVRTTAINNLAYYKQCLSSQLRTQKRNAQEQRERTHSHEQDCIARDKQSVIKARLEVQKKKDARTKFYAAALEEAERHKGAAEDAARAEIAEEDIQLAERAIRGKIKADTAIYERAAKKDAYREALKAQIVGDQRSRQLQGKSRTDADTHFLRNIGVSERTHSLRHLQDKNRAKGYNEQRLNYSQDGSPFLNFTEALDGPHKNLLKIAHLSNAQRATALQKLALKDKEEAKKRGGRPRTSIRGSCKLTGTLYD